MEELKEIDQNNYLTIYFKRVMHYSAYGVIIGGLLSRIFFMKFRTGALIGFGIGTGYCNKDLVNTFNFYFKKHI
jgi:hypothetical protein